MTKEEFKNYKKQYGKKIDKWPCSLQTDAYLYLADVNLKKSDIFSKIAIITAFLGAALQIIGLILRYIAGKVQ